MAKILKSQKNTDKLAFQGYFYRKDKSNPRTQLWRCDTKGCKGRAATPYPYGDDVDVQVRGVHGHPPDPAKADVLQVKARVREVGRETNDPPRRVVADAVAGIREEAAVRVGSATNLRRTVNRQRGNGNHPPAPQALQDIDIPDNFRLNLRNEPFVFFDSGANDGNQRIFIFGSPTGYNLLRGNCHIMADGTFKLAPELFTQIYTIHIIIRGNVIPVLYALLPNKELQSYRRMWEAVRERIPGMNPTSVLTDFEHAAHGAVREIFPNADLTGCYFHLGQSLWRRLQALGLRQRYIEDDNFRMYAKMLQALAFLPVGDVQDAFEEIRDQDDFPDDLQDLYHYFEDTYMGRLTRRGQRRAPLFSMNVWNVRGRLNAGLPRTNNQVEAWHKALQASVLMNHPTFYKLLGVLKREEGLQYLNIQQVLTGENIKISRRKYEAINRRLLTLVENYDIAEQLSFLRGISHNLELNV